MVDPSMNKFWGIVYSMIDNSDVTLEVIDARFPSICRSNQLENYVLNHENSNLLIALNKSDLVPRPHVNAWLNWFKERDFHAVAVSAKERLGTQRLRQSIMMTSKRKTALVAVVGLPNTGKSSLINTLRGKSAAAVAPIPGKTRGEQKVKVSNSIRMFDTPGVIPVKLPEKHKILLGLIPISKLKDVDVVGELFYQQAEELQPGLLSSFYQIENGENFLENLALKKNKKLKEGKPDINEAARILLRDHVRGSFSLLESIDKPLRFNY
jgi:ribosome biogenesis GTPase A